MHPSRPDEVSKLFEVTGDADRWRRVRESLSDRQNGLLTSALTFHSLDNPGVELTVFVYIAKAGDHTHLTDFSTRRGEHGTNAQLVGSFSFRSTARGSAHEHYLPVQGKWVPDTETGERHIVLDRDPEAITAHAALSRLNPYWRMRAEVERRFPAQYDYLRQKLLNRREAELGKFRIPREAPADIPRGDLSLGDGPRAVLFGLHWLDLGGAERWAIETIRLARDAGFVPIVITDIPSSHSWITRAELEGAVILTLTHPTGQPEHSEPLLERLLENFSIAGVFVHHCQWLYNRLPWLRAHVPGLPVVETLHILEYNRGGYPYHGARYDDYIDVHHVISPQLRDWLTDVQGIDEKKVALAPLFGLTTADEHAAEIKPRSDPREFRIAFVGRLAHQKRPYLFVRLAKKLVDAGLPVRFILHGSGELEGFVRHQINQFKLNAVVELVAEKTPVADTLARADLLVVSSQNEGVTLTTIEAIAAGVPVLSADVGSQRTLVTPELLVPRAPHEFLARAEALVARMIASEDDRTQYWQKERDLANAFSSLQPAHEWTRELYTTWHQ